MFSFKHIKVIPLLLLFSLLLSSCNDGTITESNSPAESPASSKQVAASSSSEEYTDLPVVECDHENSKFITKEFPALAVSKAFSKKNLFATTLSKEDGETIAQLFNNENWVKGEVALSGDWYLDITIHNGSPVQIQYSETGVFFRYEYPQKDIVHLVLTDRQRDTVNHILEKLTEKPLPSLDSSDPSSVLAYINARCDGLGIVNNKRADLLPTEIAAQISLSTPYDTLAELAGTAHFANKPRAVFDGRYPCYVEFFVLSDGSILELKIETEKNTSSATPRTIIGKRLLSISEFEEKYLTRFTEKTDERVARLRKALPLLCGLHTLADTPFANDQLGYVADLSRNDALDPSLIDQINEEMYAPEVYALLGSPHVSCSMHASGYIDVYAWYALSDGRILEVRYFPKSPSEQKQNDLLVQFGFSDNALFYEVSNITVRNESELLDWVVYTKGYYRWRSLT